MENKDIIVYNAIKCNSCGSIAHSKHRHDMSFCKCRKVAADGGIEYLRRIGNKEDYQDLSLTLENEHLLIRDKMTWGKNYDAQGNLLPQTEWILIKDITDSHLEALLVYPKLQGQAIRQVFVNEKTYRE